MSTKELDDILRQVTTRLIIMPYNNFKKVKYMVPKVTFCKLLLTQPWACTSSQGFLNRGLISEGLTMGIEKAFTCF